MPNLVGLARACVKRKIRSLVGPGNQWLMRSLTGGKARLGMQVSERNRQIGLKPIDVLSQSCYGADFRLTWAWMLRIIEQWGNRVPPRRRHMLGSVTSSAL